MLPDTANRGSIVADLVIVVVLSGFLAAVIYITPEAPVRILLGIPFVLLFPGYALVAALFPRQRGLEAVQRLSLSLGLSLVIVPMCGLLLTVSPWGIRLTPLLILLGIWVLTLSAVAYRRRQELPPGDRFVIYWKETFRRERFPREPLDIILMTTLALSVLAVATVITYYSLDIGPKEKFTEFYLLGPDGKQQDFPSTLHAGRVERVPLGIINHEHAEMTYIVEAVLDEIPVGTSGPIPLAQGERWEGELTVVIADVGETERLEFLLYRGDRNEPYRRLHIWVDVLPSGSTSVPVRSG